MGTLRSTSEGAEGQALALFALALVPLLMATGMAFDVGDMLLDRRTQQGVADAAALAGARYVATDAGKARGAALSLAGANGYADGAAGERVTVNVPPLSGPYQGRARYIEVVIASEGSHLFGGLLSLTGLQVQARAVATDQIGIGGTYSILALDRSICDAMLVAGNGSLVTYGTIQVNSSCETGALRRQGGGGIRIEVPGGSCNVVGTIVDGGTAIGCLRNEGAPALPDPLAGLQPAAIPDLPLAIARVSGSRSVPGGCPGSASPATPSAPATCQFSSSYAGTAWRLFPGLYPGGLKLQGGTFYFEPGIYHIGGGGIEITGTGTDSRSVAAGSTAGPGGGVMFYNSALPNSAIAPITLNGSSANIQLLPLDSGTRYDGLLIYQDRAYDIPGEDVTINGSASTMSVRGTIYVPTGNVKVNGGGGALTMDQILARTFSVYGSSGSQINVLNEETYRFELQAAGLVE